MSRNRPTIGRGRVRNTVTELTATTSDRATATPAARRSAGHSLRPSNRATRIVAALDSPTCSMKVSAATSSAMPCAASSTVPIQPIISAEAWNSPPSASPVSPIGTPSRQTSRSEDQSARQNRWNRWNFRNSGRSPAYSPSNSSDMTCTLSVATAEPRAPISGKPQLPKIRSQLTAMFSPTAASVTQSTTCVRPKAER